MSTECEENYTWAMEKLKSLMVPDILPKVIVTDKELALINAVTKVFPDTSHLLCRWHISRIVLSHSRQIFEHKDKSDAFISFWNVLILSLSDDEYCHVPSPGMADTIHS